MLCRITVQSSPYIVFLFQHTELYIRRSLTYYRDLAPTAAINGGVSINEEILMNTAVLDYRISEFDTQKEADEYDIWFRAKVEKSMNDTSPNLPHDEAMAFIDAELERRKSARAAR